MTTLPIIDSHIHFWDPDRLQYDWLAGVPAIQRAFLPQDLKTQAGDYPLKALIFVQAGAADAQALAEVAWVTELARKDRRIQGIVAHAPLETGVRARESLDQLASNRLVKGIRRLIQSEPAGFCLKPFFVRGVQLLAEYDLPFDICIQGGQHPSQFDEVHQLVSLCPDVRFVLDHLGKPDAVTPRWQPWADQITALARFPNVWCKLSGLVTEADLKHWRAGHLRPYIDHCLDAFGPGRCMYGGDWPVSLLAHPNGHPNTWQAWVSVLVEAIAGYSSADQQRILARNAWEFYRLKS